MVIEKVREKSKKSLRKRIYLVLGVLFVLWLIIHLFPVNEREEKAFFTEGNQPLVIAHQGGEQLAPSNTMEAFENARNLGVDVIEFDVHITKDGHLVAIHDSTVDRTTDGVGKVNDLTLEEIKQLDAANYFQDLNGEYSYRGQGVTIPTVEEIFQEFKDMRLNIELKATNDVERYEEMSERVWELIQEYEMKDQVLMVSFEQDIIDYFTQISLGQVAVSGGRQEVTKYVLLHKLFLNGLYSPKVDAIQLPTEESIFDLVDSKLINGAEKLGMDIHYWTINDEGTMRELIELGVDGIITDRPDLLLAVLGEN
ncbi:glycerophosphodiester phosphodiesterase [Alteribacter populi]|uniref:glycerophosphodiester phosphodiesterase n=1 Tax=Alteribacter populi TaxID=2011011 RepID=UPI000BBB01BE|nr:glycerophosphodiester phosphodiesterase [Alteribacter populi]